LYSAATTEAQRAAYLASGQALDAVSQYGLFYSMGFFLVAIAGLIVSMAMLRSKIFNKIVACVGIVANVLSLGNYVGSALASTNIAWLAAIVITGGLLSFIWWALIGLKLCQLGRKPAIQDAKATQME
jgi:hypothetical protein